MNRGYFINHLITNECYPDDEADVPGVSQLWHNAINGEMCYIPYDEELTVTTFCHILFELRVDPPTEFGYDSDYAVYLSFRDKLITDGIITRKK